MSNRVVKVGYLAQYRESGYDLIPLNHWQYRDERDRERGKSPRDAKWRTVQYSSEDLQRWIDDGGNIGVRLRQQDLVIDFDPRNAGEAGEGVLDELDLMYGVDLDACPAVRTGSGGLHFYLTVPVDFKFVNSLPDFPGVEFKGYGRQVVAAGSKHPNGTTYKWESAVPLAQAPAAPQALLDAIGRRSDSSTSAKAGELTNEELAILLSQIPVEEFRDHDQWLQAMMASHHATAGAGVEAFVAWSTADEAYAGDADEIRARWESVSDDREGGITIATLYKFLSDHGGRRPIPSAAEDFADLLTDTIEVKDPDGPRQPLLERTKEGKPKGTFANALEAVKALGIRPEYDDFRDKVVLRGDLGPIRNLYPELGAVWDDALMAAVRRVILELWRCELTLDKVQEAVVSVALEQPFNPVAEYLDSLKWDHKPRLDGWLTTYAGVERSSYSEAVGRIMLLSAVGRAYVPGIKYDTMVVIEGPQGGYKSTMLRVLGGEFTLEGIPHKNPNDRDVIDAMRGKWIIEMEEMAHMRRADVDSLKAFLSRTSDRARLAYARNTKDYPRRCVFVGTTNDTVYLRDITGNRRFLPVTVRKILIDDLQRDCDQLWAEAVVAWRQCADPTTLHLPKSLWKTAELEQEARRAPDPWEDAIEAFLSELEGDVDRLTTKTLLTQACGQPLARSTQYELQRLAAVMRRLGWQATRFRAEQGGAPVRGWQRVD